MSQRLPYLKIMSVLLSSLFLLQCGEQKKASSTRSAAATTDDTGEAALTETKPKTKKTSTGTKAGSATNQDCAVGQQWDQEKDSCVRVAGGGDDHITGGDPSIYPGQREDPPHNDPVTSSVTLISTSSGLGTSTGSGTGTVSATTVTTQNSASVDVIAASNTPPICSGLDAGACIGFCRWSEDDNKCVLNQPYGTKTCPNGTKWDYQLGMCYGSRTKIKWFSNSAPGSDQGDGVITALGRILLTQTATATATATSVETVADLVQRIDCVNKPLQRFELLEGPAPGEADAENKFHYEYSCGAVGFGTSTGTVVDTSSFIAKETAYAPAYITRTTTNGTVTTTAIETIKSLDVLTSHNIDCGDQAILGLQAESTLEGSVAGYYKLHYKYKCGGPAVAAADKVSRTTPLSLATSSLDLFQHNVDCGNRPMLQVQLEKRDSQYLYTYTCGAPITFVEPGFTDWAPVTSDGAEIMKNAEKLTVSCGGKPLLNFGIRLNRYRYRYEYQCGHTYLAGNSKDQTNLEKKTTDFVSVVAWSDPGHMGLNVDCGNKVLSEFRVERGNLSSSINQIRYVYKCGTPYANDVSVMPVPAANQAAFYQGIQGTPPSMTDLNTLSLRSARVNCAHRPITRFQLRKYVAAAGSADATRLWYEFQCLQPAAGANLSDEITNFDTLGERKDVSR